MTRSAIATLTAVAFAGCSQSDVDAEPEPVPPDGAASATRAPAPSAAPGGELPPGRGHILARVRESVLAYDRPDGTPVARLRPATPFGEPRTLGIVRVRDRRRWLAVHSPVFGNGEVGWIRNDPKALKLSRTRVSLRVSLSRKRVYVRRGGRTVRAIPIAIGAAGTSTPPGRFQVTDKLPASRFPQGPYGCCIIALSARQPNLPESWAGGDRIAIHGTDRPNTLGRAVSSGCLRATEPDLRALMRHVPVGAPVSITA